MSYSQKFQVATVAINTGNPQEIDVLLNKSEIDLTIVDKSPNNVVFENGTGAVIGIVYIENAGEYEQYTNYPDLFDFVPISTGRSAEKVSSALKKIIVKRISGVAAAPLDVYAANYRQ